MYEKILIPLDGSKVGEAALPYVENLVSKFSPEVKIEITLFQVLSPTIPVIVGGLEGAAVFYTPPQIEETKKKAIDYLNETGEALRSKGIMVTAKVGVGDAYEEIIKTAEEINADLIAMSTHGRSGLSRWAFGSITDRVLRHGVKIPVVVVKAPKEAEKA